MEPPRIDHYMEYPLPPTRDRTTKKFRHSDFHSFLLTQLPCTYFRLPRLFVRRIHGELITEALQSFSTEESKKVALQAVHRGRLCVLCVACRAQHGLGSKIKCMSARQTKRERKGEGGISRFSSSFSPPIHFLNNQ